MIDQCQHLNRKQRNSKIGQLFSLIKVLRSWKTQEGHWQITFTIIISCNLAAKEREINSNLNVPLCLFIYHSKYLQTWILHIFTFMVLKKKRKEQKAKRKFILCFILMYILLGTEAKRILCMQDDFIKNVYLTYLLVVIHANKIYSLLLANI